MPVGTARVSHHQMTHYLRKRVNYNDPGITTGVFFGTLPAGAMISNAHVRVNTAFNAATTNVANVGTTATGGEIIPTATILAGATGYKTGTAAAAALSFATDTDLYVSYTQTGTAATAGQLDVLIAYAPNNDQ